MAQLIVSQLISLDGYCAGPGGNPGVLAMDAAFNAYNLKRLRAAGADYSAGPAWQPYVVVDGNLITGQNPASGGAAAEALLKALANR